MERGLGLMRGDCKVQEGGCCSGAGASDSLSGSFSVLCS